MHDDDDEECISVVVAVNVVRVGEEGGKSPEHVGGGIFVSERTVEKELEAAGDAGAFVERVSEFDPLIVEDGAATKVAECTAIIVVVVVIVEEFVLP